MAMHVCMYVSSQSINIHEYALVFLERGGGEVGDIGMYGGHTLPAGVLFKSGCNWD